MEKSRHLVISEGELQEHSGFVYEGFPYWDIDDAQLLMFEKAGLEILSNLLVQERRTEFQEKLLDSLFFYSRSSLARNLLDKLVYILVALESILLKNENEPIQQNISERMAVVIGRDVGERNSIISNVKKVYSLRSQFLHHGHTTEDLETLKAFMLNAWKFFCQLIRNANRFDTREQLINVIEEDKLTPGTSWRTYFS